MAEAAKDVAIVYNPDGVLGRIPAANLKTALDLGYRLETPEEKHKREVQEKYGDTKGGIIATGLGALRGGTFGVSDWAFRGLGVDKETLAGYREAHPTKSLLGEIGGAVVPLAFSGGATAAAKGAGLLTKTAKVAGALPRALVKAGTAVEKGAAFALGEGAATGIARKVLTKAAAKGLGGALEGGVYGAGQMVSEAALGDPEEVAEKVSAHIGMSALLGGGIGAMLGAGSAAIKGVRDAAKAKAATRLAEEQAVAAEASAKVGPEAVVRTDEAGAVGTFRAAIRDFKEELKAVFDPNLNRAKAVGAQGAGPSMAVRNEKLFNTAADGSPRDARQFFGAKMRELNIVRGSDSIEQMAAKAKVAAEDWGEKLGNVYTKADEAIASGQVQLRNPGVDASGKAFAVNFESVVGRARKVVVDDYLTQGGTLAHKRAAKLLTAEIDELANAQGPAATLEQLRKVKTAIGDNCHWKKPDPSIRDKAYRKLYWVLKDEAEKTLDDVSNSIGGDLGKELRTVSENWRAATLAEELSSKAVAKKAGYATLSLSDIGVGIGSSAALGGPAGIVTGVVTAAASRTIKRRAPQLMASLVDTLTLRNFGIERIAQSANAASTNINRIVDGLTATVAPAIRRTAKAVTSQEARVATKLGTKHATKELAQEQWKSGEHLGTPITVGILKDVHFGPPDAADKGKSLYRRRYDELTRTISDPQQLQAQVQQSVRGMEESAPGLAFQTGVLVTRILQHLHDTAPKPPLRMDMAAATEPAGWEPNKHDLQAWTERIAAASRPIDTIRAGLQGKASRAALDTVKTVYPKLWADVSKQLMAKYPELQKKMPYKRRLGLSRAMGSAFTESARPKFVRNIQALYAAPGQGQQTPGAPRPSATGLGNLAVADRSQTTSERLLTR